MLSVAHLLTIITDLNIALGHQRLRQASLVIMVATTACDLRGTVTARRGISIGRLLWHTVLSEYLLSGPTRLHQQ